MLRVVVLIGCLMMIVIPAAAQNAAVPRFEPTDCNMDILEGYDPECGILYVLEDHNNPESPVIELGVAIYRSQSANPRPDPVLYLIGGPGGSALEYSFVSFPNNYRQFVEERDYIIFDQRGTLHTNPALDCPNLLDLAYELSAITGDVQTIADAQTQALIDCHDDLVETAHLSSYTSAQNAADIADLRRVLGIEEWNVFGVSYGTRLALTLMRDDPEGVRSVVLDSVYPPQVDLFGEFAANLQAAFERLFTACAQDEACNEAYPDLQTVFFELVERLNANPAHITAIHTIGNFQYSAYVNGDMVLNEVFGQMYVRARIPDLPRLIYDAYNGWEELLASAAQSFLDESYGISEGMYYSIECGEETPFTDWDAAYEDMNALPPALSLDTFLPSAQAICDAWMTNTPDSIENAPVVSDIPTLLLNGEFDPITPVRWAEDTAGYLSNSYFYIMPATGHGVVRSTDCGIGIMLAFLNDLTTAPDASCIDTVGGVDWVLP